MAEIWTVSCDSIVAGQCVLLDGNGVVYAGPLEGAPKAEGRQVLLSPSDFKLLQFYIDRMEHLRIKVAS